MEEGKYVILELDEPNKNNQIFTPNAIKGAMEKWNKEHPDDEMFIYFLLFSLERKSCPRLSSFASANWLK